MAVVVDEVGDEVTIKYKAVDEPVVKRLERHVPRTEVIERKAHAKFPKRAQCLQFDLAHADDVAIADFQFNTAWIEHRVI